MIKIFHSNSPGRLLAQLCDMIAATRQLDPRGAFAPAHVVTPDDRVAAWVKIELARRSGLMAHHVFFDLEGLAASALGLKALAAPRALRARLEVVLGDEALLKTEAMAPVLRYLGGAAHVEAAAQDATERDLLERRRFQLAGQLGELMVEYARHRPEILSGWERGESFYQGSSGATVEPWQRALWRAARQRYGTLWTPIDAAEALRAGRGELERVVHLFLPHLQARAHDVLLDALARRAVVFCYLFDPCEAFWQDLRFGRAHSGLSDGLSAQSPPGTTPLSSATVLGGAMEYQGDDSFWEAESEVPFLLKSWGFAGGAQIRALGELSGAEREDLFVPVELERGHLLGTMRRDLLKMRRSEAAALKISDRSVRVLSASSVRREVEVIASEIWRLIEENASACERDDQVELLGLNQIAVLLPEPERDLYQTHIRAIFPATRQLPYNMVDMPAKSWSRAMEALHMLLALPFGQFRRHELLRLLTHPNVLGPESQIDPQQWLTWCDDLRILHGADRRDHADTYIEGELFHWDQGLKRLCLGAMMTGQEADDRRAFELHGAHYLPHEYGQGELLSAGRLVVMARSLIADASFCRTARMPLSDWSAFFCQMVSSYLTQHEPQDELSLHTSRQLLASLRDLDLTGRPVSYRVAYEAATELLGEVEVRRGQFLLDGVVVMGLEAGRALPFKATFVAGLNEGVYPRSVSRRPEDLRFATDERGELLDPEARRVSVQQRDEDKYTLLCAAMNTSAQLTLSYVDYDARSGERRPPSALINELLYAIKQDYLPEEVASDRVAAVEAWCKREHGTRRFEQRYFPELFAAPEHDALAERALSLTPSAQPEACREASALALRHDLEAHCSAHQLVYPTRALLEASSGGNEIWPHIKRRLGLIEVPEAPDLTGERGVLRLSTFDIRAFLECPLQGSARFLLGLDEEEEEILLKESELFEPSGPAGARLLRAVFLQKLSREHAESKPFEFPEFYDDQARYFELQGLMPTGPFLRAARERHLKLLERWQENLPLLGAGRSPPMEVRHFGRPVEQEIDVASPPLAIEMRLGSERERVRVEISGRTEAMIPDVPATIIPHSSEQAHRISPKYFLRGFLDQVLMSASGEHTGSPWTVLLNPGEEAQKYKLKNCIRRFKPLDMQVARDYLRGVVSDMLTEVHAYYMPVEVVFEHEQGEEPVAQIAARKRRSRWEVTSSDHGPVHQPERFEPPERPGPIIRRRYGLYFDQLKGRR